MDTEIASERREAAGTLVLAIMRVHALSIQSTCCPDEVIGVCENCRSVGLIGEATPECESPRKG